MKYRIAVALFTIAAVFLAGSLGAVVLGHSEQDSEIVTAKLYDRAINRAEAIESATSIAAVERMDVESAYIKEMDYYSWLTSVGITPNQDVISNPKVWVMVFQGHQTVASRNGLAVHDNLEIVLNKETGHYNASTHRGQGNPPAFALDDETRVR